MYLRKHPLRSLLIFAFGTALIVAACGGDTTEPAPRRVTIVAGAGDAQFGSPGQPLADPLAALVVDASSGRAVENAVVRWRVVSGAGASLSPGSSSTDGRGVATTSLRLGPDLGTVRVEADVDGRTGGVATFEARAVRTPVLASIAPLPVVAGATVTLTGQEFSTRAEDNLVLFGGRRGRVTAASATQLTVQVPTCLPERTLAIQVRLGAVAGNTLAAAIRSTLPSPISIQRGGLRLLESADDLACLTLPPEAGSSYLLLALNAASAQGLAMPWELTGLAGAPLATTLSAAQQQPDAALAWEANVRALERRIPPGPPAAALAPQAALQPSLPKVGDRTQFNVLNRQNRTDRITAEVRAITDRAILYVDVAAPAGGFTQADLDGFGRMFDDPIHPIDVAVFGSPSDIDQNGRIIILMTPRVNALTERNENSFIAGFFYGCDLVEVQRCKDTNRAEIFYSMVPDPTGQFSGARTRETVLRTVPGVLAHEFQHMISFGRKGRLDLLWLSEGLAHMAEERVGRVFAERGDPVTALDFRRPNHIRARGYLAAPANTSLVDEDSPGTLELRGAAWLFVQYLNEHYGGDALLGRLTGPPAFGAANVQAATGRAWETVFAEFALALWAAGAPELAGVTLDARLTFGSFDLRNTVSAGPYPLRPATFDFGDLTRTGALPPAAAEYFLARAAGSSPFTLSLAGQWGGPFARGTPRLAVLRVR